MRDSCYRFRNNHNRPSKNNRIKKVKCINKTKSIPNEPWPQWDFILSNENIFIYFYFAFIRLITFHCIFIFISRICSENEKTFSMQICGSFGKLRSKWRFTYSFDGYTYIMDYTLYVYLNALRYTQCWNE